ncbi:ParB N-terminal domain-containing protein [Planococcus sp. CP5-4]|uniref:ParB N-terminal domain-containing protein n=1 Tax=unclassified Planococcus (in: firmicutes) TaxID=2662419 RepID=UPI001C22A393|nr:MULTISPECIES: ParB N-terminal domain-containing protein [unclassified Planococcus (in: firmicutes)]MBU9673917.1 ParB N-terminal domain-containing protein [Planococcus sp. CP5-4_YE]MBV0909787.1 ParB N-terminal domain-containing protein [Planococcus sp. CP5-4_UN]MBW6065271.1 ParB N-terminal domain-containing protein [Planococcus sp. CP5-4]
MSKIKANRNFTPCVPVVDDETFGGFPFTWNITSAQSWIEQNFDQVEQSVVQVAPLSTGLDSDSLDEAWIPQADLTKPLLVVRMRPEVFKLIDGNHRVAKARRLGITELPSYYLTEQQHRQFFTRQQSDTMYVDYWNEKVEQVERGWGKWAIVGEMKV